MNLLDDEGLRWKHFTEGDEFDYPIDYWAALLSAREDGHVDLLYRWEPEKYCHFHRHAAEITALVLAGELHVTEVNPETGEELGTKVKRAGDYAHKSPGEVHMERGGPEGALVLFSLYAPDGVGLLVEGLDRDGTVMGTSTVQQIFERRARRKQRGESSLSGATVDDVRVET